VAAQDLLNDLESFRAELAELFPKTPGDIAVIVHPRPWALAIAQPWLPLARMAASPASRRYMAGWFSQREIHVLSPDALEERASPVEGSREALMLSPLHEYTHIALALNNPALPPPFNPGSFARYLRWAWLIEGAAAQLAGQTPHLRGAVARRLREGRPPSFPPGARDAPLLGGTLLEMLEEGSGREAVAEITAQLDPAGPTHMIERAFARPSLEVERDWRERLATGAVGTRVRRRRGHLYEVEPDDG
jgi:hypothetical protein